MKHKVAFVIPSRNEEGTLPKLLNHSALRSQIVYVVNDASNDRTAELAADYDAIVINNHSNMGYTKSVLRGFKRALGDGIDAIITLDADGAHSVEDALSLQNDFFTNDIDLAIGDRFIANSFANHTTKRLANVVASSLFFMAVGCQSILRRDVSSGLRVFSSSVAKNLVESAKKMPEFGLCYWTIYYCIENQRKIGFFKCRVFYDVSKPLFTKRSEFLDLINTILDFRVRNGSREILVLIRVRLERKQNVVFRECSDYICARYDATLDGYIFSKLVGTFLPSHGLSECIDLR